MGVFNKSTTKTKKSSGGVFSGRSSGGPDVLKQINNYETRFKSIGKTPPKAKEETNFLLKALNVLDTPRREILKGLTGKENTADLLTGVNNKYLRTGLGFVGDVLLDPLTYLTLGTAGVAKGAATGVAKSALKSGAKKSVKTYLKFAGVPLADVTPAVKGVKKAVEATKIPEYLGPIFSNKAIRKSITTPTELPSVEAGRDLLTSFQRKIKGTEQEIMDASKKRFAGIAERAAKEAPYILEAPTQVAIKNRANAAKVARKATTIRSSGKATPYEELITQQRKSVDNGLSSAEEALNIPNVSSINAPKLTSKVSGIKRLPKVFNDKVEVKKALELKSEVSVGDVGVRVPQVVIEPVLQAIRSKTLTKELLNKTMSKLNPDEQKYLMNAVKKEIDKFVPKPIRKEIVRTERYLNSKEAELLSDDQLLQYKQFHEDLKQLSPEVQRLLPKMIPEDLAKPEVMNQVKEVLGKFNLKEALTKAENISRVPVLKSGRRAGRSLDLSIKKDPRLQVSFKNRVPDVNTKADIATLLRQAKTGTVDKALLGKVVRALPEDYKEKLFKSIQSAIKNKRMPTKTTITKLVRASTKLAKARGIKTATTEEMVTAARELGYKTTSEGVAAARIAKVLSEETARKDLEAGVKFDQVLNYVKHLYKSDIKTVRTVYNAWMKKFANVPGKDLGFQKKRSFPTIVEAKKFAMEELGIDLQVQDDIRVLTTVREIEGSRQRLINQMYKELTGIGEGIVMDEKNAPFGWVKIPVKQLDGKVVHPEIARFIDKFNSTMTSDDGVRTMFSVIDGVQNFWKGIVTAPNPAFHIRNAASNLFNNFLAGVINPEVYRLATVVYPVLEKNFDPKAIINLGETQITAGELRKTFRENGLEGFGFFFGESPKAVVRDVESLFGEKTLKQKASLVAKGRQVGDWLETNAKMAHFIDKVSKGYSPQEAADSVRKYLFDYGDLTEAEKKIRSFVPFYTFTRKNLPLQLENLITNPGKMTALYKLSENAKSAQDVEDSDIPAWMRGELAIPLGDNRHLMTDLPPIQLNMLGGGKTLKNFLGMMTPLAKVPLEVSMNRQMFTDTPIEEYPGAKARYGNVTIPANVAYALSQLGPMPRTAADIVGSIVDQEPPQSKTVPPAPKQIPLFGSFARKVDPERENILQQLRRVNELADYRKYLKEVGGETVPTMTELKKGKRGRVF